MRAGRAYLWNCDLNKKLLEIIVKLPNPTLEPRLNIYMFWRIVRKRKDVLGDWSHCTTMVLCSRCFLSFCMVHTVWIGSEIYFPSGSRLLHFKNSKNIKIEEHIGTILRCSPGNVRNTDPRTLTKNNSEITFKIVVIRHDSSIFFRFWLNSISNIKSLRELLSSY